MAPKLSFCKKSDIEKFGFYSYPHVQQKRYNSIYLSLSYIRKHIDCIFQIFDAGSLEKLDLYSMRMFEEELQPIYKFTVNCEGDCIMQIQVFFELIPLETKLEVINTARTRRHLELAKIGFYTTANLNISKHIIINPRQVFMK